MKNKQLKTIEVKNYDIQYKNMEIELLKIYGMLMLVLSEYEQPDSNI